MKTSELKHPNQPVGFDDQGTIRFKKNAIVDFLVRDMRPGYDMNTIVRMYHEGKFSYEDLLQFYQLVGYSVSGFGDLSAVKDEDWSRADKERDRLLSERSGQ